MERDNNIQEKLLNTVKAIVADPKNQWFADELRKALGVSTASPNIENSSMEKDVRMIREALHIRGNQSIDYSFVKSEEVRKHLIADNLRMENAALDFSIKNESARFYNFCVNAFYQVEGLVNYYYGVTTDEQHIVEHIQDSLNKSEYGRELNDYEKKYGLNGITIASKLTAIGVDLNLSHGMNASLYYLKDYRNSGQHRSFPENKALTPKSPKQESNREYFWSNQTFASIRALLTSFVLIVRKAIGERGGK